MRVHKYRAWDKRYKRWEASQIYIGLDGRVYSECGAQGLDETSDFIITQWTGLKDKNGKEIYEGDVVKFITKSWKSKLDGIFIGSVKYYDGCFCIETITSNHNDICDGFYNPDKNFAWAELEIVGNIFENPELLEKK